MAKNGTSEEKCGKGNEGMRMVAKRRRRERKEYGGKGGGRQGCTRHKINFGTFLCYRHPIKMGRTVLEKQWQGDNNHAVHDGHPGTGGAEKALKATCIMIHFAMGDVALQKRRCLYALSNQSSGAGEGRKE